MFVAQLGALDGSASRLQDHLNLEAVEEFTSDAHLLSKGPPLLWVHASLTADPLVQGFRLAVSSISALPCSSTEGGLMNSEDQSLVADAATADALYTYSVTALQMPIYFNAHGDHDPNGLVFVLTRNVPLLKYIRALSRVGSPPGLQGPDVIDEDDVPDTWKRDAQRIASELKVELPLSPKDARKPHPLVRPLVLRARLNDEVRVQLHNQVKNRRVGIHLVADGYDVKVADGSQIGANPSSLVRPGAARTYTWRCRHEGVFPFHDGGNYDGSEDGTNVHGLFGALIVEPAGAIWRDPVSGRGSVDEKGRLRELDGLYLDVLPSGKAQDNDFTEWSAGEATQDAQAWPGAPQEYHKFDREAHREFVIFFHDEPEFVPATPEPHPCGHGHHGEKSTGEARRLGDGHDGNRAGHPGIPPIMPVSYRAEPMISREYILWRMIKHHGPITPPVLNEEQHHSSWMFGDPDTPILKAYIGDPVRIRFVHAAVKETHVFHLHLYEWHAVPQDDQSPRIDAISISPQTGHTIEPLWGAGNRQQVPGDVIWHCHLYPHFHEGMWGMFRTFDTLQTGEDGALLQSSDPAYHGRRIGRYPDGLPIEKLLPLPDRPAPPRPTAQRPGYPLFIPGTMEKKSPRPPWPDREYEQGEERWCKLRSLLAAEMPADFDYRPTPTDLERNAFNAQPVPGELFTRNPFAKQQAEQWDKHPEFRQNGEKEVCHDVVVDKMRIDYNDHGWHDRDGHLYYLAAEGQPKTRRGPKTPLFFRARHGQIVNLTLANKLPYKIEQTEFDPEFPPCPPKLDWEAECALHVHMVKFDPISADGASVGWNYMSGPRHGKKMAYRWWADQEFGTIFFHDHLFANYRQKHGLFGALLVEPIGARFYDNVTNRPIVSGPQAIVVRPDGYKFREFCIGIGDFIPMWDRRNTPLNRPAHPGGHGDQGVMGLNYRNAPIRERLRNDPAFWFSSRVHGDPDTTIFGTYPNEPIWFRVLQGSHEEQHSFQVHGMRWRRFRGNRDSSIRNQQTFGISEAFTFINEEPYGPGDYLYKLSGADDLWLGCWGIIRAFPLEVTLQDSGGLLALADVPGGDEGEQERDDEADPTPQPSATGGVPPRRRFHVVAEHRRLVYRERRPREVDASGRELGQSALIDPFGLIFRVTKEWRPGDSDWRDIASPALHEIVEPLILRCREGEQVEVTLENRLASIARPEPFAPEVPLEKRDRPVSEHVSIHADLLRYDVTRHDGANVGRNPRQTVEPSQDGRHDTRTYVWHAVRPPNSDPTEPSNGGEPLGPVLLQDMADFRNHRHHGLVGALIVEHRDATPLAVPHGEATAATDAPEAWHGARATIVQGTDRSEEIVLLLQDGLRLYFDGNTHSPAPDVPADPGDDDAEHEDQGQKAFNYRTEPVGLFDPTRPRDILGIADPATPTWHVPVEKKVRFHLLGACDKPRNYSFTIHGVSWPEWRFLSPGKQPRVASESAITAGTARTFEFIPEHVGDHCYRAGVLKWAVHQGLWGILRVV